MNRLEHINQEHERAKAAIHRQLGHDLCKFAVGIMTFFAMLNLLIVGFS